MPVVFIYSLIAYTYITIHMPFRAYYAVKENCLEVIQGSLYMVCKVISLRKQLFHFSRDGFSIGHACQLFGGDAHHLAHFGG